MDCPGTEDTNGPDSEVSQITAMQNTLAATGADFAALLVVEYMDTVPGQGLGAFVSHVQYVVQLLGNHDMFKAAVFLVVNKVPSHPTVFEQGKWCVKTDADVKAELKCFLQRVLEILSDPTTLKRGMDDEDMRSRCQQLVSALIAKPDRLEILRCPLQPGPARTCPFLDQCRIAILKMVRSCKDFIPHRDLGVALPADARLDLDRQARELTEVVEERLQRVWAVAKEYVRVLLKGLSTEEAMKALRGCQNLNEVPEVSHVWQQVEERLNELRGLQGFLRHDVVSPLEAHAADCRGRIDSYARCWAHFFERLVALRDWLWSYEVQVQPWLYCVQDFHHWGKDTQERATPRVTRENFALFLNMLGTVGLQWQPLADSVSVELDDAQLQRINDLLAAALCNELKVTERDDELEVEGVCLALSAVRPFLMKEPADVTISQQDTPAEHQGKDIGAMKKLGSTVKAFFTGQVKQATAVESGVDAGSGPFAPATKQVRRVTLIARDTFFVDCSLRAAGLELLVVAPRWQVVGDGHHIINLDGEPGLPFDHAAEKGEDSSIVVPAEDFPIPEGATRGALKPGKAGAPGSEGSTGGAGGPGGAFLGVGAQFIDGHRLTVSACGGKGADGQQGGAGGAGGPGADGRAAFFKEAAEFACGEAKSRVRVVYNLRTRMFYGSPGGAGGQGGSGGAGGPGGLPGKVLILSTAGSSDWLTSPQSVDLVALAGAPGEGGPGGPGGKGGEHGTDSQGKLHFALFIPVRSQNVLVDTEQVLAPWGGPGARGAEGRAERTALCYEHFEIEHFMTTACRLAGHEPVAQLQFLSPDRRGLAKGFISHLQKGRADHSWFEFKPKYVIEPSEWSVTRQPGQLSVQGESLTLSAVRSLLRPGASDGQEAAELDKKAAPEAKTEADGRIQSRTTPTIVTLFAWNTFFVDCSWSAPGLKLSVVAPRWHIIGVGTSNSVSHVINLDGEPGAPYKFPAQNGADCDPESDASVQNGSPGRPGQDGSSGRRGHAGRRGGALFGVVAQLVEGLCLDVSACGGSGADGQQGGDGGNGGFGKADNELQCGAGGNGGEGGAGGLAGEVHVLSVALLSSPGTPRLVVGPGQPGKGGAGGQGGIKAVSFKTKKLKRGKQGEAGSDGAALQGPDSAAAIFSDSEKDDLLQACARGFMPLKAACRRREALVKEFEINIQKGCGDQCWRRHWVNDLTRKESGLK